MRHSCMAFHLSSESTPLVGMGNEEILKYDFFFSFILFLVSLIFPCGGLPVKSKLGSTVQNGHENKLK